MVTFDQVNFAEDGAAMQALAGSCMFRRGSGVVIIDGTTVAAGLPGAVLSGLLCSGDAQADLTS